MNYCRLCGQERNRLTSIFKKKNMIEDIHRYLQIQICEEDTLPHRICDACENEIERIVLYITECQRAQRKLHKLIFSTETKIREEAIKLEDPPLDLDTKVEVDYSQEYPNVCSLEKKIIFTLTVPELPTTGDGEPNSSIIIKGNSDQLSLLLAIGKDNLKRLGKDLYKKNMHRVLEKKNVQLLFSEVQDDFTRLQKQLEKTVDPLSECESRIDSKAEEVKSELKVQVPKITLNTSNPPTEAVSNPVESRTDTSEFFNLSNRNGSKLFLCSHCPFETIQRFRLNQHYREVHEKRFPCKQCRKRFGKESRLLQHYKKDHTDLPPIVCSLCTMSFTQRHSYKEHLKTHSNEGRSWSCDHCDKSFDQQHKLDVHLAKCHRSRSVKCPRCPYIAAHKYQIGQHIREVHLKPVICAECGKRESKKSRMLIHIKNKHMTKTTYECEVCTTKYTSKKWFEVHRRKGCPGALPI